MDTLKSPFYDKMIRNALSNFSDMVIVGERAESGMRNGKIVYLMNNTMIQRNSQKEGRGC